MKYKKNICLHTDNVSSDNCIWTGKAQNKTNTHQTVHI